MTTKIFLPPLDSTWRLTEDWAPSIGFLNAYDHTELAKNFGLDLACTKWAENPARRDRYVEWQQEQIAQAKAFFPKGTVIIFDRYHISHSGLDAITVRILASPDQRINPRKMGGKGKGRMRCYFSIAELNSLPELEEAVL